jgi:hypothetical protein
MLPKMEAGSLSELWPHGKSGRSEFQVFLPKVRGVETGRVITMTTHGDHLLRILGEATDPLFPSGIAEVLNREPGSAGVYTSLEIAVCLKHISDQAVQVQDGR